MTDTIQNQSVFPAGATRVKYYLSADGDKNATDRILTGFRAVAELSAGGVSTGTKSVTIPIGTVGGSYFLLACADDAAQVAETVEANNCRASTGRVTVAP